MMGSSGGLGSESPDIPQSLCIILNGGSIFLTSEADPINNSTGPIAVMDSGLKILQVNKVGFGTKFKQKGRN